MWNWRQKKKKKNEEQSHSHLYSSKETWSFQGSFLHLPEQFETTGLAVEGVKVRSRACSTGWHCQRAEKSEKPRALGPGATWEQTACVQRSFQTTPFVCSSPRGSQDKAHLSLWSPEDTEA